MLQKTVLIVDDDQVLADLYSVYLSSRGYVTYCAYSGAQGLQRAIEVRPDLMLLDLNMPDITGREVLSELIKRRIFTRVIILTAQSDLQTAVSLIKAGAYDFVAKPSNPESLFWRIERAMALQDSANTVIARQDEPEFRKYYETTNSLMRSRNYDAAVVEAFKFMEEQLRMMLQVSSNEFYGEKLINLAFAQNDGKLQTRRGDNEQKALRNFVSGAYAFFRNPAAHRQVQFDEFSASTIVNIVVLICDTAKKIKNGMLNLEPMQ